MPRQSIKFVSLNPVLDDILERDQEMFVLDGNMIKCVRTATPESPLASNRLKNMRLSDNLTSLVSAKIESEFEISLNQKDYYEVDVSKTRKLEVYGCENSLFLALARSILYKVHYIDQKYAHIIKTVYAHCFQEPSAVKFNSDMKLQELLRKSLCIHWLGFVYNGEFKTACKYSRHFQNACDFMYQAYQLSVNNFSNNRLFDLFALEDFSELLKIRIVAFEVAANKDEPAIVKIYEPKEAIGKKNLLNDSVYLRVTNNGKIKYKWLMPNRLRSHVDQAVNGSASFIRLKSAAYIRYKILMEQDALRRRFDNEFINQSVNHALFLRFLCECSVHTLVSLEDLKFDSYIRSKDSKPMIDFLNTLWGQHHFNQNEILNQIQFNNELERIHMENKSFIQEVFKYNSTTISRNSKIDKISQQLEGRVDGSRIIKPVLFNKIKKGKEIVKSSISTSEQIPIDYSLKKNNSEASKRKSVSECLPSENIAGNSVSSCLISNLYKMNSCFRDDEQNQYQESENKIAEKAAVQRKLSKSCQDIDKSANSSSSSSILDGWINLTIPLMNSLVAQQTLKDKPSNAVESEAFTQTQCETSQILSQKRSLTWCVDSLIGRSRASGNQAQAESLLDNTPEPIKKK